MIGLVFATHVEARPFLEKTGAVQVGQTPFDQFQAHSGNGSDIQVVISGMGKVAATMAAMHLILAHTATVLINAGVCGWLGNASTLLRTGTLFRVSTAVEGDCDRFGKPETPIFCGNNSWFSELPAARLVTCDRPVFDTDRRTRLSAMGELADMEGAAIARAAASFGCSWAMVKGITDAADKNGRAAIFRNIDRVSAAIAETLTRQTFNIFHSSTDT